VSGKEVRVLGIREARKILLDSIRGMDQDDLAAAVSELGEYYGDNVVVRATDGWASWVHRKGSPLKGGRRWYVEEGGAK